MQNWVKKHKFEAHTIAFLAMLLPAIPLYYAANSGSTIWIVIFLGIIMAANLFAVLVK